MNFKDAYKSYNDEIKGNPRVLKAILDKKEKRSFVFTYRHALSYAAMAAIVISVSVFSFNYFHKSDVPEVRYIVANMESEQGNTGEKEQLAMANNHAKTADESVNSKEARINRQAEKNIGLAAGSKNGGIREPGNEVYSSKTDSDLMHSEPMTNYSESTPVRVYTNDYEADISEYKEKSARAPVPADTDDSVNNPDTAETTDTAVQEIPSGNEAGSFSRRRSVGGGSESTETFNESQANIPQLTSITDDENLPSVVSVADNSSEISYSEYTDYLGIDIKEKAILPSDMSFESMPSAQVEYIDGEIISGTITVSAHSADNINRSLSLSVSKNSSGIQEASNGISYSYRDNTNEIVGAYTASANISVSLESENLSKNEVDELMNSLK